MRYVEVAVHAPIGYDRTLSYGVPSHLELEVGQLVWAPLGTRPVQGIVIDLAHHPRVEEVKDVLAAVEPSPLLFPRSIDLARWISRYYMCPLFDAAALMLPPGFRTRVRSYIRPTTDLSQSSAVEGSPEKAALGYLARRGEVAEKDMAKSLGTRGEPEIQRLLRKGLAQRRWELVSPRVFHRYECHVRPASPLGRAMAKEPASQKKSPKKTALYNTLKSAGVPIPLSIANKEYGAAPVSALLMAGLLALEWTRVDREPALQREFEAPNEIGIVLTDEQERALAQVTSAMKDKPEGPTPFLLHGITGSGKTEVYIRALEYCKRIGRQGMYLVPEIALTPQTLHRLNARFPGRVAVIHSRLSIGEQFDQWWRIKNGFYDVVVGPRSAVFAPLLNVGLIILDEEHEWTYKQQDVSPRYHARDVALKLADMAGAVVIMGSATPDVETYFRARSGQYKLLELPRRINVVNGAQVKSGSLASVEVCDMRQELKEGNRSIFSRALSDALQQCVDSGEQGILFLNRRGASTMVQCRDCGHALRCRSCSVTLTYHASDMRLLCHQCNRRSTVPKACSRCRSPRIKYLGLGTQRVAEELGRLMPDVAALRWDGDTARTPRAHQDIMERFLRGEAQILIGTQMVAKGIHVPNVSLVGVILADIGLNLPDFRSGERAFQLLCQVAGRAGRGDSPGRVIIQTYNPANYAVQAAAAQDYGLIYEREIQFRQQQGDPPFNRLAHMVYLHTNVDACQREAERMGRSLRQRVAALGLTDIDVVGPAPGLPERVRGRYKWHLIIRGRNLHAFLEEVTIQQGWTLDMDPITLL